MLEAQRVTQRDAGEGYREGGSSSRVNIHGSRVVDGTQ